MAGPVLAEEPPEEAEFIPPLSIDPLLFDSILWEQERDTMEEAMNPYELKWMSEARESARSIRPGMTLLGEPVNELIIRFKDKRPDQVTASFYNRGDIGRIRIDAFDTLGQKLTSDLTSHTGKEPERIESLRGRSQWDTQTLLWNLEPTVFRLELSKTEVKKTGRFRPEFVLLTLTPFTNEAAFSISDRKKIDIDVFTLREKVQKSPDGEIRLKEIPMVDQGEKGYCATASVERVLRYYGADVSQHELAQYANTQQMGTYPDQLYDALKSISAQYQFAVKKIEMMEGEDFLELIEDYNKEAKNRDLQALPLSYGTPLALYYKNMDVEALREVRLDNSMKFRRFRDQITANLDDGIPLLWGVMLGVIEEPEIPQALGGHMRIIFGYDPDEEQILYTDSWGIGHEEKRMSLEDAFIITTSLFSIASL